MSEDPLTAAEFERRLQGRRLAAAVAAAFSAAWPALVDLLAGSRMRHSGLLAAAGAVQALLIYDILAPGARRAEERQAGGAAAGLAEARGSGVTVLTMAWSVAVLLCAVTGNSGSGHSKAGARIALAATLATLPLLARPAVPETMAPVASAVGRGLLHTSIGLYALALGVTLTGPPPLAAPMAA